MSRAGGKVSSSSIKAAGGAGLSRRAVLGGVLAAGAALPLGGCDLFNDTVRYRTKLILEVETPSGLKRGASVVEWYYSVVPQSMRKFYFPDACCAWGGIEKGEATVVDLGDGKYLFATLKGFGSIETGIERAGVPFDSPSKIRKTLRKMRKGKIPRRYPLQPDDLPLLVTFTDINDPKTVKRVDPRNLATTFGPGYRLKAAWVEVTDEPVTTGRVEKVLGWLGNHRGRLRPTNKKYAKYLTIEEKIYPSDFMVRRP